MATLILTVIGDDRPGLVSTLSASIGAHGASWEHSQMSRLGGKFAGIVLVEVAEKKVDALTADLVALDAEGLLVVAERTADPDDSPDEPETLRLRLDLIGADHPGIVAEISAALADRSVSIEELSTDVRDAPMAGGTVFEASAVLKAPSRATAEEVRAMLEELADDLMVDVTLTDDPPGT